MMKGRDYSYTALKTGQEQLKIRMHGEWRQQLQTC